MINQSTLKTSAIVAGGLVWAVVCSLLGLGLLSYASSADGDLPRVAQAGGVVFVAGGLFVFLVFVADQVFPQAPRWMTEIVKTAINLVVWVALLVVLYRLWLAIL
jgi:hypothetical protein